MDKISLCKIGHLEAGDPVELGQQVGSLDSALPTHGHHTVELPGTEWSAWHGAGQRKVLKALKYTIRCGNDRQVCPHCGPTGFANLVTRLLPVSTHS